MPPQDSNDIDLGANYVLRAPGLTVDVQELGSAVRSGGESGYRASGLEEAIAAHGMHAERVFSIDVQSEETTAVRSFETRSGEDAVQLQVPVAKGQEAAVLHTDENGCSTWVFPDPESRRESPVRAGSDLTFSLPKSTPPGNEAAIGTRGALTKLGRRIVRVITWATDPLVGAAAYAYFKDWETRKHPYGMRSFPFQIDSPEPDWGLVGGGPALLFVHGTFSSAFGGFSSLSPETCLRLQKGYEGRVLGFDHPTLHLSPDDNAKKLVEMLAAKLDKNAEYEFDVITHSRGGLVLRSLCAHLDELTVNGPRIRIRKAILVAAPNLGTPLADGDHGIDFLDRYTNMFTNLPDNVFTGLAESAFGVVKLIYHGGVGSLPGLMAMNPGGDFVRALSPATGAPTEIHAIVADFNAALEPSFKGLLTKGLDGFVDACFDKEANDLVVPTNGGFERERGEEDWIPEGRRLRLDGTAGIYHLNYFGSPKVTQAILKWLLPEQPAAEVTLTAATPVAVRGGEAALEAFGVGEEVADSGDLEGEFATRGFEMAVDAPAEPPKESATPARPARYLNARAPGKAAVGEQFPLTVRVELQPVGKQPGTGSTDFDGGEGGKAIYGPVSIDVYAPGFRFEGSSSQTLNVPETGPSDPVRFLLTPEQAGSFTIEVNAWKGSVFAGTLTLEIGVGAHAAGDGAASGGIVARAPAAGEFTLEVEFDPDRNRYCFQFRGEGFNGEPVFGEPLAGDRQAIYNGIVKDLNTQARDLYNWPASRIDRWLKGMGGDMYRELMPEAIKHELWTRRDQVRRLNILSRKDNLPWELLYVVPDEQDPDAEGYFLADRATICRWVYGNGPVQSLHTSKLQYVLPSGGPAAATAEIDMLDQVLGKGDRIGDIDTLSSSLDAGKFDLLHFAAHNVQSTQGRSYVPMGADKFETNNLGAYPKGKYRASSPLIFMNACTSAGAVPLYTELNGWAGRFLDLGCGAFVGSLWEVRDLSARSFAEAFYRELRTGKTLAEAMIAGRAALSPGDPTRFAYTLYGNPEARLVGNN